MSQKLIYVDDGYTIFHKREELHFALCDLRKRALNKRPLGAEAWWILRSPEDSSFMAIVCMRNNIDAAVRVMVRSYAAFTAEEILDWSEYEGAQS